MRRFGKLNETEQNLQAALWPTIAMPNGGPLEKPPVSEHPAVPGLGGAHRFDHDLADISAFTTKYEDAASKVIASAANGCK